MESVRAKLPPVHHDDAEEIQRLRRELDLRNIALDAATSHFLVLDTSQPVHRILYVNRALARAHGYEPAELMGQDNLEMLFSSEQNLDEIKRLNQAVRRGDAVRVQLWARRRDGSTFWVGATVAPVRDAAGKIVQLVSVGADITERLKEQEEQRQLQEQLFNEMRERERIAIELRLAQKLESVGRLAAGVAHEINTPIQYVADSVLFLRDGERDLKALSDSYRNGFRRLRAGEPVSKVLPDIDAAEQALDLDFLQLEIPKAFDRTLDGVERVSGIVRAMKEFAHPDTNEQQPADINHAIETTLIVARAEYKYIAMVDTQLGALPAVVCNIGELNQVFLNLIVNAAHAIETSGKSVENGLITISTTAAGDRVTVSIGDNGCGIPAENIEKIFDPFFTTKEVGKGTGQGLAITRSIVVEKHGGKIDVQSAVGVGTRFHIELPVGGRPARGTAV